MNRAKAARFWSAPAERSGDGALDLLRTAVETPISSVPRPQNPKRRGASLPAALQDAGPPCTDRGKFMVPMRAKMSVGPTHEPAVPERGSATRSSFANPIAFGKVHAS